MRHGRITAPDCTLSGTAENQAGSQVPECDLSDALQHRPAILEFYLFG